MGWVNEYVLGEWVEISVFCQNASGENANPTAAPTITLYKTDDTPITGADDLTMARFSPGRLTGVFKRAIQLDADFSAGIYNYIVQYTVSGSTFQETGSFQIVAGGNAQGAYVALFYYQRPHANYIVGQLDDGTLEMRRGPKL